MLRRGDREADQDGLPIDTVTDPIGTQVAPSADASALKTSPVRVSQPVRQLQVVHRHFSRAAAGHVFDPEIDPFEEGAPAFTRPADSETYLAVGDSES